jgi:putative aldouronate transport system permease protein
MVEEGGNMKKRKKSVSDIVLDIIIYSILVVIVMVTFYPMWYVLVASFSPGSYIASHGTTLLWPGEFTVEAYKLTLEHPLLMGSLRNSLVILVLSLPVNIVLTVLCGYFMASTKMLWKKLITAIIMFTMFFSGGMIPQFLNVKSLGLYNTVWALVFPGALSIYNAIICKTAMEAIPDSLHEAAYLDGANDFSVLFRIILPLIKPTLAVLLLYYGVSHWNSWFNASIYITDKEKLPVQNILREVLVENNPLTQGDSYNAYAETIQYAAIVVITVPILCVYPFLQKHFAKGVMIGAVKG